MNEASGDTGMTSKDNVCMDWWWWWCVCVYCLHVCVHMNEPVHGCMDGICVCACLCVSCMFCLCLVMTETLHV